MLFSRHALQSRDISRWSAFLCCLWVALLPGRLQADPGAWLDPNGWPGTLVIIGGGEVPEEAAKLLQRSTGDGSVVILAEAAEEPKAAAESAAGWLNEHTITNSVVIDFSLATEERWRQTVTAINAASTVWICGGQQSRLAEAFRGSGVEQSLQSLLRRGGTIAGTSAGAAIMSKTMIASGHDEPVVAVGWDLLPDAIIDQHFTERQRSGRSQIAVDSHRECFGLGIDESTAVMITGRRMQVVGKGTATVLLGKTSYRDAEVTRLTSGQTADLTQLRRSARQRATGVDPGIPQHGVAEVTSGALVIVGGGAMPPDVVDRFVELAGGESARIVVLPTAVPRTAAGDNDVPGFLKREAVTNITVLEQRGPDEVSTAEFQLALKSATGVWFGGGRQWGFVDAYEGTQAIELFRDVLQRGGVIAGSSAGATIQGEFLVRGHPLGNTIMMAEGYERGFAFLPGTAIDQHFSQRARQPDLLPVIRRHPGLLGIGIDEGTAVVVTKSSAEVIGQHAAHFLTAGQLQTAAADQELPVAAKDAQKLYVSVTSGSSASDLATLIKTVRKSGNADAE